MPLEARRLPGISLIRHLALLVLIVSTGALAALLVPELASRSDSVFVVLLMLFLIYESAGLIWLREKQILSVTRIILDGILASTVGGVVVVRFSVGVIPLICFFVLSAFLLTVIFSLDSGESRRLRRAALMANLAVVTTIAFTGFVMNSSEVGAYFDSLRNHSVDWFVGAVEGTSSLVSSWGDTIDSWLATERNSKIVMIIVFLLSGIWAVRCEHERERRDRELGEYFASHFHQSGSP